MAGSRRALPFSVFDPASLSPPPPPPSLSLSLFVLSRSACDRSISRGSLQGCGENVCAGKAEQRKPSVLSEHSDPDKINLPGQYVSLISDSISPRSSMATIRYAAIRAPLALKIFLVDSSGRSDGRTDGRCISI